MYPNKLWQLHCSFNIEKPNTNITCLFRFLSTWTSRTAWDWATLLRARLQWPRFLSLGLLLLYSEPATCPPGLPSDPLDVIITTVPWHQRVSSTLHYKLLQLLTLLALFTLSTWLTLVTWFTLLTSFTMLTWFTLFTWFTLLTWLTRPSCDLPAAFPRIQDP